MTRSSDPGRPPRFPQRWLPRLALAASASALLVLVHRTVAQWSDHTGVFVSATAVAVLVVVLAGWALSALVSPFWRFVRSLAHTLWDAGSRDPEIARFTERHPRIWEWFRQRTTVKSWHGLYLSASVLLTGYFLVQFLSLARRAMSAGPIAAYDTQLSALLRAFRTPELTRILWVFTVLGDTRVAFALTALAVGLLAVWGRRREALLVLVTVAGGTLLGAVMKRFFERARPEAAFALIREPSSFSLPSGHALYAMLFWGILAFVFVRLAPTTLRKAAIAVVAATAIVLTGLSRVYLGVHWPSDVLSSWLLALSWMSACTGAYLMLDRYGQRFVAAPLIPRAPRYALATAAVAVAAAVVAAGASADPLLAEAVTQPTRPWTISLDASGSPAPTAAQARALPRVSEKLDGTAQEPIGLVFIGTRKEIVAAFTSAGWSVADAPSPVTLLHALVVAYADLPYPTAPVTPSFVAGQVQDIAFEKPAGRPTIRRRHHVRWWRTDLTFGPRPVWVATASLDERIEIGPVIPVISHRIAADIDAEQAYIASDLSREGVRAATRVRVVPPSAGTNAQGDQWFTRGVATVLVPADL